MKSFLKFLVEDSPKKIETDKKILSLWTSSADIEDIVKSSGKSKIYIKNLLKRNGKKGWETI